MSVRAESMQKWERAEIARSAVEATLTADEALRVTPETFARFFTAAVPQTTFVLLVNLTVFAGVGVAMIDVFQRVMGRLEPARQAPPTWWLVLVGTIGGELFYFFNLFHFAGQTGT